MTNIIITILRKSAWKPLVLTTTPEYHLSICQILEKSDNVEKYSVSDIDIKFFTVHDMYVPSDAFPKWVKSFRFSQYD